MQSRRQDYPTNSHAPILDNLANDEFLNVAMSVKDLCFYYGF